MSQKSINYHYSVMGKEVEEFLLPVLQKEGARYVDATLGEGGHMFRLLSHFPALQAVGIEADAQILKRAQERLAPFYGRVEFINDWSHHFFQGEPHKFFDGILMDLGISTFHYHSSGRGFSFAKEERLDMRLNPTEGEPASEIVNTFLERDLADLFYKGGEERLSRFYARAIVEARRLKAIETSKELSDLIWRIAPNRYGKIHPATRIFQALRIHVNGELSRLETLLWNALKYLQVGGRLAVITFHSLEDRIVKQAFRSWVKEEGSPFRLVHKKPLQASQEEIRDNPPSRSARLRILERLSL